MSGSRAKRPCGSGQMHRSRDQRGKAKETLLLIDRAKLILEEIRPAGVHAICYRLFVNGWLRSMTRNHADPRSLCQELAIWRCIDTPHEIRARSPIPKDERYRPIAGSGNTLYQINMVRPNVPAMLVEGELDALSVTQEAGDLIAIVATGSTAGGRLERWIGRLAMCSIVLISFDADVAGDEASSWWCKALGPRAKRWRPYWGDANAMLQAGADLRTWVREGLCQGPHWWREVARWPPDRRDWLDERAAIMEVDGGLGRDEAEMQALALLAKRAG